MSASDINKVVLERKSSMLPSYYTLADELCRGRFSKTKRCINIVTAEEYSAKIIDLSLMESLTCLTLKDIEREIVIRKQLCHPNIVQVFEDFKIEGQIYIITELVTGFDICSEVVNKVDNGYAYSEAVARFYMRQILEGLKYIHDCQVVHRNLRPLCMVLSSAHETAPVKITDFEVALKLPEKNFYIQTEPVGASEFMAPEVADGKAYNYSVDIWGFGVTLFILLTGENLFKCSQTQENVSNQLLKHMSSSDSDCLSETVRDVLNKTLEQDPFKRISAASLLQHPWFNDKQQIPRFHLQNTVELLRKFNERQKELNNCGVQPISANILSSDRRQSCFSITATPASKSVKISTLNESESNEPMPCTVEQTLNAFLKIHDLTKKSKDENDVSKLKANASSLKNEVCAIISMIPSEQKIDNEKVNTLINLLERPHFKALLKAYDETIMELQESDQQLKNGSIVGLYGNFPDNLTRVRLVQFHRPHSEPLGITVKMNKNKQCVVARIIHGGMIHRQGTLNIGDEIKEVNGTNVSMKSVEMVQKILNNAIGDVSLKVVPGRRKEEIGQNELYVRCLFDYNPSDDDLIPCQQAGLSFKCGEILEIKSKSDTLWWQAVKQGKHDVAGLIPSHELQEKRIMNMEAQKKTQRTKKLSWLSHKKNLKQNYIASLNTAYDKLDLKTYEEVAYRESFSRKTLVLIGACGVGRRHIKKNLIAQFPKKFSTPAICTSCECEVQNADDEKYVFVKEGEMLADISQHKYLNYYQDKGYLYGITLESLHRIISDGLIPILDVETPVLKLLRCKEFSPCVVFISSPETFPASGDPTLDSDLRRLAVESAEIFKCYRHFFDHVIINNSIENTVDQIMNYVTLREQSPDWLPVGWLY